MPKSSEAFRSISEVADELAVPKHVLRFWEMRFPQVKPMKRGGGRRYYRPADVELLKGIRHLLHAEGYTIKGVQKIFRDQGPDEVQRCWREGGLTLPVPIVPQTTRGASRQSVAPGPGGMSERRRALTSILAELVACRDQLSQALGPALPPPSETAADRRPAPRGRTAERAVKKRSGL